jgi:hypothetical protein
MPKLDLSAYTNLSDPIKEIATKYFSACVMERVQAKNRNCIATELQKLHGDALDTRKFLNKNSRYWYKKFDGQAFDASTILAIEALLPNISHALLHPIWRILDTDASDLYSFSSSLQSLGQKFSKYLYKKGGASIGERKLIKHNDIFRIADDYSLDSLALLILLAKEVMSEKQLHIIEKHDYFRALGRIIPMAGLQITLMEIRNLIFTLCLERPFKTIYCDIYCFIYKELFSKESLYLQPFHDDDPEEERKSKSFNQGSIYPYYYVPTTFIPPVRSVLDKYLDDLLDYIESRVSNKTIKVNKQKEKLHNVVSNELLNY